MIKKKFKMRLFSKIGLFLLACILIAGMSGCNNSSTPTTLNFTVAIDENQRVSPHYQTGYIPSTFLVDQDGIVRYLKIGGFASKEQVMASVNLLLDDPSTANLSPEELGLIAPDIEAPDFTLPTLAGEEITLSELVKETPVVLNFWAIRCPPCKEELPYLNAAAGEYAGQVSFVLINIEDRASEVQDFFS